MTNSSCKRNHLLDGQPFTEIASSLSSKKPRREQTMPNGLTILKTLKAVKKPTQTEITSQKEDALKAGSPACQSEPNRSIRPNLTTAASSKPRSSDPVDADLPGGQNISPHMLIMSLWYVVTEVVEFYSYLLDQSERSIARSIADSRSNEATHLLLRLNDSKQKTNWISELEMVQNYSETMAQFGPRALAFATDELVKQGILLATDDIHDQYCRPTALDILPSLCAKKLKDIFLMIPGNYKSANKKEHLQQLKNLLETPDSLPTTPMRAIRLRTQKQIRSSKFPMSPLSQRVETPVRFKLSAHGTPRSKTKIKPRQCSITDELPADKIAKDIIKIKFDTPMVKLNPILTATLRRIRLVIESAGIPFYDDRILRSNLPKFDFRPVTHLFKHRSHLLAYEDARKLETRANEAFSKRSYRLLLQLGAVAALLIQPASLETDDKKEADDLLKSEFPNLLKYQEDIGNIQPFRKRFTPLWICLMVLYDSVTALQSKKLHEESIKRLKIVLSSRITISSMWRAHALNELCSIIELHRGPISALPCIIEALEDSNINLNIGDRHTLASRAAQLHETIMRDGRPKGKFTDNVLQEIKDKAPECVRILMEKHTRKIPHETCYRKPIPVNVDRNPRIADTGKNPFDPKKSYTTFKDQVEAEAGTREYVLYEPFDGAKERVTLQELAVQFYEKKGWKVFRDDGSLIRFLFCLLLWESGLFTPAEDVFHNMYQNKPNDLLTEAFYTSRKERIESRLVQLKGLSPSQLEVEIRTLYQKYRGIEAFGCDWNKYTVDVLASVSRGIGSEGIAEICRLIAKDYAYWKAGIGDLILYRTVKNNVKVKFITVKHAKEELSPREKGWIYHLLDSKLNFEILRISHGLNPDLND